MSSGFVVNLSGKEFKDFLSYPRIILRVEGRQSYFIIQQVKQPLTKKYQQRILETKDTIVNIIVKNVKTKTGKKKDRF